MRYALWMIIGPVVLFELLLMMCVPLPVGFPAALSMERILNHR